jgi:hypothetical protein
MFQSLLLKLALPFLSGALSRTLRRVLTDGALRSGVLELIATAARAANMSKDERRVWAIARVRELLDRSEIGVTDSELSLLVEVVYGWLKRTQPGAVAPAPTPLGRR